jgi:P-type Ca2+ transporter type 2C
LGLTTKQADDRLEKLGSNVISVKEKSLWQVYLAPLFDTLIVIYLIMTLLLAIFAVLLGDSPIEITLWLVLISINMSIAIFQQYRAKQKVQALQKITPRSARVVRDGIKMEILAEHLVVGDIMDISLGDRISVDARLIEANNLSINEASLTGESIAIYKNIDLTSALPEDTPISSHKNMVYLGTFVETGNGKAIVTATGNNTELGKISSAIGELHTFEIPLRTRINTLGKYLGLLMVLFLSMLVIFGLRRRIAIDGELTIENLSDVMTTSIITAMVVMPINIPLLTTIILVTGVLHMANKNVVVKRLAVIETLGRTSVLCSDKTGTMTTSEMTVVLVWDTKDFYGVTDDIEEFYRSNKERERLSEDFGEVDPDTSFGHLIISGIMNNEAILQEAEVGLTTKHAEGRFRVIGNATDGALLQLGLKSDIDMGGLHQRYVKLNTYPFDSTVKRMSTLFLDSKLNEYSLFSKGATDVILERCTNIGSWDKNEPLTADKMKDISFLVNHYGSEGYRIISVATKHLKELPKDLTTEEERIFMESELTYLGFIVIVDPPRTGVRDAVQKLDDAGIFPVMITGDAASTAATIARQVGILDPDEIVVEGKDIPMLSDEKFFKTAVFARVSPKDKQLIVDRYQKRGDVVTMTGDGVNDALAVTQADAGVVMGITGTEVAKEAADLIISDDSFVSLVNGVAEGRNLYEKIRLMIFFFIAINVSEGVMYFYMSFQMDFALNSMQQLYILAFAHTLPPLAIIFGVEDKNIMKLKPRKTEALIPLMLLILLITFSVVFAIIMVMTYFIFFSNILHSNTPHLNSYNIIIDNSLFTANPVDWSQAKARTMMITVIIIVECFIIFSIHRVNGSIFYGIKEANLFIWTVILLPIIIHLALMYYPIYPLTQIPLDLIKLTMNDWLIAIGISLIPIIITELIKFIVHRKDLQF